MMARPKPWEMAQAIPVPYAPNYGVNLSPTLQTPSQARASSSYTASCGPVPPFGPPKSGVFEYEYNVSPQMRNSTDWASAGPTISPDLGSFSLDPDMAYEPLTTATASSSNQPSSQQTPSTSGPFDTSDTSLDDTFSTYMDFGDPLAPTAKQDETDTGDVSTSGPGGTALQRPSPGIYSSSSSSTPAPTSHAHLSGGGIDHTPSSSHSL